MIKITDDGYNAYLGDEKARSGLYVRQMKGESGGHEYKVGMTKHPVLLRILHIFTGIHTKYFYGVDALKIIKDQNLMLEPLIKKDELKEEQKKEEPPPLKKEEEPLLVKDDGFQIKKEEEPLLVKDDGFQKFDINELVDVDSYEYFSGEEDFVFVEDEKKLLEAQILDPELRTFNIKEVVHEVQELAQKFAQQSNPSSIEVRGQKNLGNTCYLNSTLQCLETTYGIHDPKCAELIRKDLSLEGGEDIKRLENRLLKSWIPLADEEEILFKWTYLLLLQAKLKGTDAEIEQALKLHHKLFFVITTIDDFKKDIFGQKDGAEYLEYWLQILGAKGMTVSDVITADINGQTREKEKSNPTANLISVPISKHPHKTLISRITESCLENIQTDEGTDFKVGNFTEIAFEYTKTTRYKNPPDALHLHLVRFENEGGYLEKNNKKLEMEDIDKPIDLSSFFDKQAKYQLTSFTVHQGDLHGGHYVAYVMRNGQWYYCSDETNHKVDKSRVPFGEAYLMSFSKI
jgi:uncharacterized UBP type Zn finger protein